jgi:ATP-binding cassette subfamily B protein
VPTFSSSVGDNSGVEPPVQPIPHRVWRFLLRYVALRPGHFAVLFACVLSAAACAVMVQVAMKLLVDTMAAPDRDPAPVWTALAIFVSLIAMESILWRASGWFGSRTIVATGVDIRLHLFQHLSGHPSSFFTDRLGGALAHRITGTAGNFGALVSTVIWNIVPPCTDFVGALILFSRVDWRMSGVLALFVGLVAAGLIVFGIKGRQYHHAYADRANAANGELVDSIANMWTVKAFSARRHESQSLAGVFKVEGAAQRASWLYLEKTRILHDLCLWLLAGAMLAWVVHLWTTGMVTPGDVVLVSALTFRILHGSRDLAFALIGAVQNITFIADTLKEIGRPHSVRDAPGARPLRTSSGSLAFERVSFTYPNGKSVLRDFSLTIPGGQKVGIVGASGAGKSTLLALIQRMYDPQSGIISIDGQCIAEVTQDSLREAVAVVPQDVSLFHRSIIDNLRYGRLASSDNEVIAASEAALCDPFIRKLAQGYDTVVGDRGAKLSGGERQRIAIGRAILKDAPILLLDEATSSLDTDAETRIRDALVRLEKGRTVIAVAHRLSTVAGYDRIVVLRDGEIVEDGRPADLLRSGGVFSSMWRLQMDPHAGEHLSGERLSA